MTAHDAHVEHEAHQEHAMDHDHQETMPAEHTAHDRSSGDHGGHDKHEGHSPEMFRDRLLVSILLTIPILYFSPQIQDWFGFEAVSFTGSEWITAILGTILYVYAGSVFLKGGYREIRDRQPGMMTLISMAISVAYFYSLAVSFGLDGDPFYWELATLLVVMLLGHWIEMRSVQSASNALEHLASMVPTVANKVVSGDVIEVDVASLTENDIILIRPGDQVPVDGEIIDGASSLNEAFLTGESRPVSKEVGDEVIAGAVNGEGVLTARVTRTGDATTLSQIMRLVEEAQASRSQYQVLADRAAFWLTIIAIGVAIPTFVIWAVFGSEGITFAVARSVTVLVIACPHALGLAIPLVNVNATGISAQNGILVRNREAFERGRDVSLVAMDKTGTLTEGKFAVSGVTVAVADEDRVLTLAASLEKVSEHPLAEAIAQEATSRDLTVPTSSSVTAVPGRGLEGEVEGELIRVGRPEWAEELGVRMPDALVSSLANADERGESAVVVMNESDGLAVITLADQVRQSAPATIEYLRGLGVTPVMVSGDAEAVVATVASDLGIDRYYSRVLPEDKARIISELKAEGEVAFVGDGINDAPALLAADLGIAIGAGTDVAIESADLVLIEDDPSDVARIITLARATHRKMIQNLAWATGYNVLAIPLAAGVAVSAGILLSPAIGALFMSLSTVIVSLNAMLLRRTDLTMS
jgi:Cu2+-exporting ATPase